MSSPMSDYSHSQDSRDFISDYKRKITSDPRLEFHQDQLMSDSMSLLIGVLEHIVTGIFIFKHAQDPLYDGYIWRAAFPSWSIGVIHIIIMYILLIRRRRASLHRR